MMKYCRKMVKSELTIMTKYVRCQRLWSVVSEYGSEKGIDEIANGV